VLNRVREGNELPFEFSGDGDDANLCFVESNGLFGVKAGTVRFTSVDGNKVTFAFSGSFSIYDGQGGESAAPVDASGTGRQSPRDGACSRVRST
jgi:hypothetical protein